MIIIDKETGEALLPGGTRIGPQTTLAQWFENPLARNCLYMVNDPTGSPKRVKEGGPQRFSYSELPNRLQWQWVWFWTAVFVRDEYRLRLNPFYESGELQTIGISAQMEARALQETAKSWPEYSAEDERDQRTVLWRDLGEPNGTLTCYHQKGRIIANPTPGYSLPWGNAAVGRDPHARITSIELQYPPRIKKLIRQQQIYAEQELL